MPIRQQKDIDSTAELIRDLMIVQLGLASVPQAAIRKIVGVSINRVNRIVKLLKKTE
jgi:hypothetical protein